MIIAEVPTKYNHRPARLCTVKYDKGQKGIRDKSFVVANGVEITRVPANGYRDRNAKELASLLALEFDRPDLIKMVKQIFSDYLLHSDVQAIKSRAIKAGFIVRDGLIDFDVPIYLGATVCEIQSQSRNGEAYSVDEREDGALICSCPDWYNGHLRSRMHEDDPKRPRWGAPETYPGQIECKHIMAYRFALKLKNQEVFEETPAWVTPPPPESPSLEKFIGQIETELSNLAMILQEAKNTLAWLNGPTLAKLEDTCHPFMLRGKVCFRVEFPADQIRQEIE